MNLSYYGFNLEYIALFTSNDIHIKFSFSSIFEMSLTPRHVNGSLLLCLVYHTFNGMPNYLLVIRRKIGINSKATKMTMPLVRKDAGSLVTAAK